MAARGAASKEMVANKILETFPNAFKYEKEIRIPVEENGETIQIKVTLTAAKTNVGAGDDTALPGADVASFTASAAPAELKGDAKMAVEPTEKEKKNIKDFLNLMGLGS